MTTERYEISLFDPTMGEAEVRRVASVGQAMQAATAWMAAGNGGAYVYRQVPVPTGRGRQRAERWGRPMPVYKITRAGDGTVREFTEFPAGGDLPTIVGVRQ